MPGGRNIQSDSHAAARGDAATRHGYSCNLLAHILHKYLRKKMALQRLLAGALMTEYGCCSWSSLDLRQRHRSQRLVTLSARLTDPVIGNSFSSPTVLYSL